MAGSTKTASSATSFGAVARCAAAAARDCAQHLADSRRWQATDIHRTRVLFKKLRAVVHLGRGLVKKRERAAWNARLRDAARMLSQARDGTVMHELIDQAAAQAPAACLTGLKALQARLALTFPQRQRPGARASTLAALTAVATEWPESWGQVSARPEAGLRHMRAAATSNAREALRDHHPETWHDWRRRVKYVAYQLEWLASARNKKTGAKYKQWRRLGSALGKLNDLHNLTAWLAAHPSRSAAAKFLADWAATASKKWENQAKTAAKDLRLG